MSSILVSFATAACSGSPLNALIGCKITEKSFLVHSFFLWDMPSGGGVGVLGSSTCVRVRHGCISSLKTKVHQKVLIKVIEMMGAMGGDR